MSSFEEKCAALEAALDGFARKNVMVAFSGGVDSSLLLELACRAAKAHGTTVYAMTIQTRLHPSGEAAAAKAAAEAMGARHRIIRVDELAAAGIENNPVDRCYRCKKYMFGEALRAAQALGIDTVLDGTNEDDTHQYRPGIRALRELGITSPLVQCGFTKADVRRLAAEQGIAAAEKPANPCMATRFPYDTPLCYEDLNRAERAEELIRAHGFYNVRARVHGCLVRIEVDRADISRLMALGDELTPQLHALGYDYVSVDLDGFRSGSQDVNVPR